MSTTKRISYREVGDWNVDTSITIQDDGRHTAPTETIMMCMLATIRDELRRLNHVLQCPNFIAVPAKLDQIAKNTRKRRKPRAVGKPKLRVVAR
jgi:hypothetical protein